MHLRAAEVFGINNLPDGSFHERWTGQIQAAALGHQDLVAENWQIRSAGDAVSHDGRELRNAGGGDDRVVPKDPSEIVFIGKNLILHRQKNPGGIDEVNNGQVAFEGDALSAD